MAVQAMRFLTDAENRSNGTRGLVLEKFADELLFEFLHTLTTAPLQRIKDLVGTDTYAWPVFGELPTEYHKVGEVMEGDDAPSIMRKVTVDDMLVYKFEVHDFDVRMADWEIRSEYTSRGGLKLANTWELNTMAVRILASRQTAFTDSKTGYIFSGGGVNVAGEHYGNGTAWIDTNMDHADKNTRGLAILDGIEEAAINFLERDIPEGEWYCALRPRDYMWAKNAITNSGNGTPIVLNKDWASGGAPGFDAIGEGFMWAGVSVLRQARTPFGKTYTTGPTQYQGDFSDTIGVVWHPAATATVRLMGMEVEQERSAKSKTDFTVVSMAVGTNYLRPECAIELAVA